MPSPSPSPAALADVDRDTFAHALADVDRDTFTHVADKEGEEEEILMCFGRFVFVSRPSSTVPTRVAMENWPNSSIDRIAPSTPRLYVLLSSQKL